MIRTRRFARFDAILNTDICNARTNADIILVMRIGFQQINPTYDASTGTYPGPNRRRKIVRWDRREWENWKQLARLSAQRFWDGRFWLLNNRGVLPVSTPTGIYIPNFHCRLRLEVGDFVQGHFHHQVKVLRLDPSEPFYRSNAHLFTNLDINSRQTGTGHHGAPVFQTTIAHEVGHLLGLDHVDLGKPHCPTKENQNEPDCYGVTAYDMNSVMGSGMQLRGSHARPWFESLKEIVRSEPSSAVYHPDARFVSQVRPELVLHYPRTIAEFEAGSQLRSLPRGR